MPYGLLFFPRPVDHYATSSIDRNRIDFLHVVLPEKRTILGVRLWHCLFLFFIFYFVLDIPIRFFHRAEPFLVDTLVTNAIGSTTVPLPSRKYRTIRIPADALGGFGYRAPNALGDHLAIR